MTGYQEVLTDPSYNGQIVTMTYPLIGNYGINAEDQESRGVQVDGFIVRELTRIPSNFRSHRDLDALPARPATSSASRASTPGRWSAGCASAGR